MIEPVPPETLERLIDRVSSIETRESLVPRLPPVPEEIADDKGFEICTQDTNLSNFPSVEQMLFAPELFDALKTLLLDLDEYVISIITKFARIEVGFNTYNRFTDFAENDFGFTNAALYRPNCKQTNAPSPDYQTIYTDFVVRKSAHIRFVVHNKLDEMWFGIRTNLDKFYFNVNDENTRRGRYRFHSRHIDACWVHQNATIRGSSEGDFAYYCGRLRWGDSVPSEEIPKLGPGKRDHSDGSFQFYGLGNLHILQRVGTGDKLDLFIDVPNGRFHAFVNDVFQASHDELDLGTQAVFYATLDRPGDHVEMEVIGQGLKYFKENPIRLGGEV